MLPDTIFDASNIFDHNAQLFEIIRSKRKNGPASCSTSNVEKEDNVTSVSDGKSVVKPDLAYLYEDNIVAESDLTSNK